MPLVSCAAAGVRQVCDRNGSTIHPLAHSPQPVIDYALSPDRTMLVYTRRDASGLPHLFLMNVDGTGMVQLTHGSNYADSRPYWTVSDNSDVSYERQVVSGQENQRRLGPAKLWSVSIDGSGNSPF